MNATALIAEDEPILAQALATKLARAWPELQLLPIAEDGVQAVERALAELPDVCFLDIQMPERSGLEVAEILAEQWPQDKPLPRIVFVTAYDEYAVAAFDRAAVDYVLKPVQAERLAMTCERLREQLQWRLKDAPAGTDASVDNDPAQAASGAHTAPVATEHTLLAALRALYSAGAQKLGWPDALPAQTPLRVIQVAVGPSLQMVQIEDVLYFEAADKYVRIITSQSHPQAPDLLIRTPLRELIPRLDADQFWQVHRSMVVNVKFIERVAREYGRLRVHIKGRSETLEVSRMYAHLFKAM